MVNLSDEKITKLLVLLKQQPRAGKRNNRTYIDTGNNRELIGLKRHTVIFGRRGSGKTMLLSELFPLAKAEHAGMLWIDIDDYKTLTFPDILIQLLRALFAGVQRDLQSLNPWWKTHKWLRSKNVISAVTKEEQSLTKMLDRFEEAEISREVLSEKSQTLSKANEMGVKNRSLAGKSSDSSARSDRSSSKETASGKEKKSDLISRHLHDAKQLLQKALEQSYSTYYLVLDDFYHLHPEDQAQVLDFLQSLTKNLDVFVKFGTIAHRSRLYKQDGSIISGMQKEHDVLAIDLDRTFQNYSEVETFIRQLWLQILKSNELTELEGLFGGDSWKQIVLASGGTPRDFMNILAKTLEIGRSRSREKIDVNLVNEAANLYLRETKHEDLISDGSRATGELENLLMDIRTFCVDDKKRNLFLIDKDFLESRPDQSELLRQLVDFRFIHLVHSNTSAAGRHGRFEAYMLDVGLYSYPQRRGKNKVKQVDFLQRDEKHRADAVRAQSIYVIKESYVDRIGDPFEFDETTTGSDSEVAEPEELIDESGQRLLGF